MHIVAHQASLEITSDLAELARVRSFLRDVCRQEIDPASVPESLAQLELAVTEAISNIMVHAYQRQKDRPIRLKTEMAGNRLELWVYHRGEPFEPEKVVSPALDHPRACRMGLQIIRQCVDQVGYDTSPDGESSVHMVKTLKPEPKEGE